jgi:uncharacterized protein YkwD
VAGAGISALAADSPALVAALDAVRASGCDGRRGTEIRFEHSAQLTEAAKRLALGAPLRAALGEAGYRATRSSVLQLSGDPREKSVVSFVAKNACASLIDPEMREIGIFQHARTTWIILAAPFAPPPADAADAVAARVLDLVNQARARARVCGRKSVAAAGRLALNVRLSEASRGHAADMAQHGYLAHMGRDGSTPAERAKRAGYRWRSVGENIASGPITPEEVVAGWLRSPPHCANLMASQFTEMGVAYSVNRASRAGIYWVQLFGTPQ